MIGSGRRPLPFDLRLETSSLAERSLSGTVPRSLSPSSFASLPLTAKTHIGKSERNRLERPFKRGAP